MSIPYGLPAFPVADGMRLGRWRKWEEFPWLFDNGVMVKIWSGSAYRYRLDEYGQIEGHILGGFHGPWRLWSEPVPVQKWYEDHYKYSSQGAFYEWYGNEDLPSWTLDTFTGTLS